MLSLLTIQNIRLIEQLELSFSPGLFVLSGETGAGKSILLEALGLALGERAEGGLIRQGAVQGSVVAIFELPPIHGIWSLLKEQGFEIEPADSLVMRRLISREGTLSRAFVNDQPVSLNFLRKVAALLVDVHGQFDHFLVGADHTALIDQYGALQGSRETVAVAYEHWKTQQQVLAESQRHAQQAREQLEFIQHSLCELQDLAPQVEEEKTLLAQRSRLSYQEKLRETLQEIETCLSGSQGVSLRLAQANRLIERLLPLADTQGSILKEAVTRVFAELEELESLLKEMAQEEEGGLTSLESLDDRLFRLKAVARKHQVTVAELPLLQETFQRQLELCFQTEESQGRWEEALRISREDYIQKATTLHQQRLEAARRLEQCIAQELPALKLEKAKFHVHVTPLKEEGWRPQGTHMLEFHVATNPGEPAGPLYRGASGGELSRFLLALKVVLAECSPVSTLIFDEIDSGTGGAVAEAIGLRLRSLSAHVQVLAITHAPQVAAQAHHHGKVLKEETPQGHVTRVVFLNEAQHLEEIARMLSGAMITEEARAAALKLKRTG